MKVWISAIGLVATCAVSMAFAGEPLKQEGKKSLYQRVLTTPNCELRSDLSETSGKKIPAFSRYYVYERKDFRGSEWIKVGPDSYGKTEGWLDSNCAVNWNIQMTMIFTNPVGRESMLFFKDKSTIEKIVDSETPAKMVEPLRKELNAKGKSESILAEEPKEYIDIEKNFYLLPILESEEVLGGDGNYQRLLRVASVSKPAPAKADNASEQEVVPFKAGIVFVVDSTKSMQPYIDSVKKAMKDIYAQIEKDNLQEQVQFGLVSYRSSLKHNSKIEFVSKIFADPNMIKSGKDFQKSIENLNQADVSTAYFYEDGYAGILNAIDDINWKNFSARYIIMVTDASSMMADDPLSSTNMNARELRFEAKSKGIAIYVLHLKTAAGKQDHKRAEQQYTELAFNDFVKKPLYYPVNAGDVNDFTKKVDTLGKLISEQVGKAYKGEDAIGNIGNEEDDEMLLDTQLLGKAMQLAYLGSVNNVTAPPVFESWVSDRDFRNTAIPTAKPHLLLTKSQLSDLSDVVNQILKASIEGMTRPDEMFNQLRSIASAMGNDPNQLKNDSAMKIADLGLLDEYLEGVPYKSDITALDEDSWRSMSAQEQDKFIKSLEDKLRYYKKYHDNTDAWISLTENSDPREDVSPIPLEMLP